MNKINELKTIILEDKRIHKQKLMDLNETIEDLKEEIYNLKRRNPDNYVSKTLYKTLQFDLEEAESANEELHNQILQLEYNIENLKRKYKESKKQKKITIFDFFKNNKEAA